MNQPNWMTGLSRLCNFHPCSITLDPKESSDDEFDNLGTSNAERDGKDVDKYNVTQMFD